MRHLRASSDLAIARIASRQHGVVSVGQLREAGLDKYSVMRRVRSGRLHPVHRGVYAVGHTSPSPERRWMAAVLAGGIGAVLSYRSAASLWGLLPVQKGVDVEISVPSDAGKRRRKGIRVHRCASLHRGHATRRHGIPVTTPARTVSDLQSAVSPPALRRALRQAAVLGLPLGQVDFDEPTRSELEFLFLELCRKNRLPTPEVNRRIGSLIVDFVWPDRRLVVETDGYKYHRGRISFEDDRSRDLELKTLGYEVIRLTHHQVVKRSDDVVAVLGKKLSN